MIFFCGVDMNSDISTLLAPWGKLSKKTKAYHPLILHMLDVSACMEVLLERESWRFERFSILKPLSQGEQIRLLSFLAAAHDLGKVFAHFQWGPGDKLPKALERTLLDDPLLGEDMARGKTGNRLDVCHGYLSIYWLCSFFFGPGLKNCSEFPHPLWHLAFAVGHHHDKFLSYSSYKRVPWFVPRSDNYFSLKALGCDKWVDAALRLIWEMLLPSMAVEDVVTRLSTSRTPGKHWPKELVSDLVQVAGAVSLSDWVASTVDFFPLAVSNRGLKGLALDDFVAYRAEAKRKAVHAFDHLGRRADPPLQSFSGQDFESLFTFSPNPLQHIVTEHLSLFEEPALLLVEAPMGLGKTEAALASMLAERNVATRGLYMALPTMASGNQMYLRLRDVLERVGAGRQKKIQFQLMQSNRTWNREFLKTIYDNQNRIRPYETNSVSVEDGDNPKWVHASDWLANSKTGLFAEFGVGTVDQLLMAVLLGNRHYFAKLFALAGKIVVFDEVHAFDYYQKEIFKTLLCWLRELGCHVILLSATLPGAFRKEMVEAFCGTAIDEKDLPVYPRVVGYRGGIATPFFQAAVNLVRAPKRVNFEIKNFFDRSDLIDLLLKEIEALGHKGVFAVICNTVSAAQMIYEELIKHGLSAESLDLFHARFVTAQKEKKESKLLRELGKEGLKQGERPRFRIAIGTQVLEQSLDISFDRMFTFLCPIDLLFQRIGRLHRIYYWGLVKSDELPTVTILQQILADGSSCFEFEGMSWVYHDFILRRTEQILKERLADSQKNVLDDRNDLMDLVGRVYDFNCVSDDVLLDSYLKFESTECRDVYKALVSVIPTPDSCEVRLQKGHKPPFCTWFNQILLKRKDLLDEEVSSLQTRLGEPSIRLVLVPTHQNKRFVFDGDGNLLELPNGHISVTQDVEIAGMLIESSLSVRLSWLKGSAIETFEPCAHSGLRHCGWVCLEKRKGFWQLKGLPHLRYDRELGLIKKELKEGERQHGRR